MDFTPTNFPTMGVSEKEFLDKMIELAKPAMTLWSI